MENMFLNIFLSLKYYWSTQIYKDEIVIIKVY